jgi:CRP/FNR family cyclic AMP-dependent transcriptional regulator
LTDAVDVPQVLRSLPDHDVERLLRVSRENTYARREVLVHEGEDSGSFHIVLDGRVAVQITKPSGETSIVNILGPDSHFGEVSLLGAGTPYRTATVVALEPVRTLSIPAAVFHELRERNPRLEQLVSRLLAQRVQELTALLVEAMYDSLDRRVVRRLAGLCVVYASSSPGAVTIPLTQEEVAELCGGTRPSVNQVLHRLVDEGILELGRGRIVVPDPRALQRLDA